MIRVVVAEDQALIRQSFARLIDSHPDMKVVAEVANGADAVRHAASADVIVMDVRMPVMDGIEATRRIVRKGASAAGKDPAKVLVLTTFREEELVLGALDAGASGFLLKDSNPHDLLSAIARIAGGEGVLDPKVTPMVLRHITPARASSPGQSHTDFPEFTPREREILELVCEGLSNDDIARRLVVATTTVKTHMKSLLSKTGTKRRIELVIWAARHELL